LFLLPFCVLLIYFSWPIVQTAFKIREMSPDPGGLPRYPLKAFLIVSPVLLFIQGISEAIKNLAVLVGAADPSLVAEEQRRDTLELE
jgi:TRAP-type mannitol/chloroaromatic compound transport system permease small subunit